jgi:hypothetical protein
MIYPTPDMQKFRFRVYKFVQTLIKLGLCDNQEIVDIHNDIKRTGVDGPKRAQTKTKTG